MKFNLIQFLISISFVLDFIELDILDTITNHCKRVGYITLKLGEEFDLTEEERFALLAFAILHDIGGVENKENVSKSELEKIQKHCTAGEKVISRFPLLEEYENIILYHHENYDGTGFFGREGEEIPLFSQIIALADYCELIYAEDKSRDEIITEIEKQRNKKFSPKLVDVFRQISQPKSFWLDLQDKFILTAIETESPQLIVDYSYDQLEKITRLFSDIIDSKSRFTQVHSTGLSQKAEQMAGFYDFSEQKKNKFVIAADLHDLGKIAVPNSILDKPGKLTDQEYKRIKAHPYYTRRALDQIDGFTEITDWAANHHEKLDGSGYPYGLTKAELDFPSQIMGCLDIYQALTENRPYRPPKNHQEALEIITNLAEEDKLNSQVVNDIDKVFG